MWRINVVVKNDIKELHMWNYKIGLNNEIYKKIKTVQQIFSVKILKGET